ncbi:MAG: methyltransferase [Siculibacillus sp.]|nr:methyltransferase [Siculibacillus sp.]
MTRRPIGDPSEFIRSNTRLQAPPHVPEISLHLADEAMDLWKLTEEELDTLGLPLPFWAFAWAGGQALARYVLDHPETVAGKNVLVFAGGSGLEAIAAVKCGAARVLATEIDPFALVAMELNAGMNGVRFEIADFDVLDLGFAGLPFRPETVLLGDVFFEKPLATRVATFAAEATACGATALVGDPGRSYLPKERLVRLAEYRVPVTRALEDAEVKRTVVWRFHG